VVTGIHTQFASVPTGITENIYPKFTDVGEEEPEGGDMLQDARLGQDSNALESDGPQLLNGD
jgi:hypothetical protein